MTVIMYTLTTTVSICLFIATLVDLYTPDVDVDTRIDTIAHENNISVDLLHRLSRLEPSTGGRYEDIHANVDTLLTASAFMMLAACVIELVMTMHYACTHEEATKPEQQPGKAENVVPIKLDTLNPILTVFVSIVILTRAHMATYDRNLQLAFLFVSMMVIRLTKTELHWSIDWIVGHKRSAIDDQNKHNMERVFVYISSMLKGMIVGFEVLLFFSAFVAYGTRVATVFNDTDSSIYTQDINRSDDMKLLIGDFKLSLALVIVYSITCWMCPRKALSTLVSHARSAGLVTPIGQNTVGKFSRNRGHKNHNVPPEIEPAYKKVFVYYLTTLPLKILATVWVIGYYNEWFDLVPSYINDMVPSYKTSGHDTYIAIAVAVCILDLVMTLAICLCVLIASMKTVAKNSAKQKAAL